MTDVLGYGLMVLGIGIPASISIAKMVPDRSNGNGELRRITAMVARLEERSKAHAEDIQRIQSLLDSLVASLNKRK